MVSGLKRLRLGQSKSSLTAIRFVSFEPLIGSVSKLDLNSIDYVIVGGENGHLARKISEKCIDEIHCQCIQHKVTCFFKQFGTW